MGKKIFVSYKYSDSHVQDLNIYEDVKDFWGNVQRQKVTTTARHYVDRIDELLESNDHIYKGEDDGEDLSDFKDSTIASKLRDKIYDSSITIVLISKGMRESYTAESDQWIPWEISNSLKELTRDGRTSKTNAVLAVVIPDESNSYNYFLTYDSECNCTNHKTLILFEILRKNMFNQKNPTTSICKNQTVYSGEYSYIKCVKWSDFINDIDKYIDIAMKIKDNKENYNITKQVN